MPLFGQEHLRGMRRVFKQIIGAITLATFDLRNLLANRNHGIHKAVKLSEAFRFGRFNHQGAGHRKAHGRGMKTIIH